MLRAEAYLVNQKSPSSNRDFIKEALQGDLGEDNQLDLQLHSLTDVDIC